MACGEQGADQLGAGVGDEDHAARERRDQLEEELDRTATRANPGASRVVPTGAVRPLTQRDSGGLSDAMSKMSLSWFFVRARVSGRSLISPHAE